MSRTKQVSIQSFAKWLQDNIHKTWYIRDLTKGGFAGKPGHTHLIKYIRPTVDTRTMEIYSITIEGSFPEGKMNVHCGEDFDGTILELLESKFPDVFKKT